MSENGRPAAQGPCGADQKKLQRAEITWSRARATVCAASKASADAIATSPTKSHLSGLDERAATGEPALSIRTRAVRES